MPVTITDVNNLLIDCDNGVTTAITDTASVTAIVTSLQTDVTAAFSRALALIAAGGPDLQVTIDKLNALKTKIASLSQSISDLQTPLQSLDAQAKIEFN